MPQDEEWLDCLPWDGQEASIPTGAEISFNTPYAVVMHESENYTPSHPGTGPNYLRGPLLKAEGKYHRDLQALFK